MFVEQLDNGFFRIYCRRSGSWGLFNPDGSHRGGFRFPAARRMIRDYMEAEK